MKPMQFKMSTGSIYVGFPGPIDQYGMFQVSGACTLTYLASKQCYDVRGVMTSTYPLEVNLSCVQSRQEIVGDTDSALAYCSYLGSLVATLEDQGREVPQQFNTYIDYMNPYFMDQFEGVDIYLSGKHDYAAFCEDDAKMKDYRQQMVRAKREYKEKALTGEEKSCQPNVVHLQFGSRSNASEKSED